MTYLKTNQRRRNAERRHSLHFPSWIHQLNCRPRCGRPGICCHYNPVCIRLTGSLKIGLSLCSPEGALEDLLKLDSFGMVRLDKSALNIFLANVSLSLSDSLCISKYETSSFVTFSVLDSSTEL